MQYDNVNYIPTKDVKVNAFTVRTTDRTHKIILRIAADMRNNRAPATIDLVELGAKEYGRIHGISLSEADIDAYLIEHEILES